MKCAELFARVFNGEPWNETWTVADAAVRIGDIVSAPKFVGLVIEDTEIHGFVIGNTIRIEANDIFELKEMCIALRSQQNGLGTALLDVLKTRLSQMDHDAIFLQTSHKTPAYHFYLKNGFNREAHFTALSFAL